MVMLVYHDHDDYHEPLEVRIARQEVENTMVNMIIFSPAPKCQNPLILFTLFSPFGVIRKHDNGRGVSIGDGEYILRTAF